MRTTRGGVLGVCLIDPDRGELICATVGNVAQHQGGHSGVGGRHVRGDQERVPDAACSGRS
ncbi:hypothetical protein [Streptomyces blattellae]|uniref:hypothetical protein n=1 Tax=Streptomyces blattellae TaxID=2569855 RepID=UPI0012B78E8F|nr:hypothetical protein [Streptomyces blattellae]